MELQAMVSASCMRLNTGVLQVSLTKGYGKKIVQCSLWEWKGATQDEGDEVAAWLSAFLDKSVRLVRYLGEILLILLMSSINFNLANSDMQCARARRCEIPWVLITEHLKYTRHACEH